MYLPRCLNELACAVTMSYFPACEAGLRLKGRRINVWRIPFKQSPGMILKGLHEKMSCEETFLACYWICLLFSLVGFVEAISEFVRVYSDQDYEPNTFWNRTYRNIPLEFQRKARLFGSALNIALGLFLLYGFLNFRHIFMYPWIVVTSAIVLLESFYWISNVLRNKTFKWNPFSSVLFLLIRLLLVIHVSLLMAELSID